MLEAYRNRRVLLTGGTGFIGRWVGRALASAGAELHIAVRDEAALTELREPYQLLGDACFADLSAHEDLAKLCEEIRPEVIFNLAGYGVTPDERDPELARALNVELPRKMAHWLAGNEAGLPGGWAGLRLVHTGSAFEYGSVPDEVTEASPARPAGLYGQTKLEGTKELLAVRRRTGAKLTVVRLFTVYGPGEHPRRLLPTIFRAAETGETLPMTSGEQQRDFAFVADVADGLLRLGLQGDAPELVNLATGKLTPVRSFAECAASVAGLRPGQIEFGALPTRPDEVRQGPANTALLEKTLGWIPSTTVADGVRRSFQFGTSLRVSQHSVNGSSIR